METAVVGHTEWITFADVDAVPTAGGIAHTTNEWETPGGGGAVAAVQLAKLAGSATFFTATGDDDIGTRTQRELTSLGVDVRAATRSDTRSRRALTLIDPAGERTIVTLGDRLAPAAADPLGWDDLDTMDAVYVTAGDPGALAHARRGLVHGGDGPDPPRAARHRCRPRRPGGQRTRPERGRPDRSPALAPTHDRAHRGRARWHVRDRRRHHRTAGSPPRSHRGATPTVRATRSRRASRSRSDRAVRRRTPWRSPRDAVPRARAAADRTPVS